MLVIYLQQNYFDCIEPSGKVVTTHFSDVDCCIGSLHYDASIVSSLEPIDLFYDRAVERGWSGEQIIGAILWRYHRFRYFRVGYLSNREMTLGFIGHRGSGKSVSATAVAIVDFMLNGYTCWSNMPIKVMVVYRDARRLFEALPLGKLQLLQKDDSFRRGVVVLDEVNVSFADATMFMSKTNRELSNFTQQMRKRGISIIWSAQSWNSVDPRLKFQTDFCTWCEDTYLRHPGVARYTGEVASWTCMDVSGMSGNISLEDELRTKWLLEKTVWQGNFHSRPWWYSYNTWEIQGKEEYSMKELEKMALAGGANYQLPENITDNPVERLISLAKERCLDKLPCQAVWDENNITDKATQTIIGQAFIGAGYKKKRNSRGYYWELAELNKANK